MIDKSYQSYRKSVLSKLFLTCYTRTISKKEIFMKKRLSTIFTAVLLIASILLTPIVSAASKTKIVVATDSDTAPYTYRQDDKFAGYDIDLVKAIFKGSKDYEVTFETVPFSSILTGIDAGRYQIGANNFNYNEERAEKYLFSDAVSQSNYAIASKKGVKLASLEDLSGKSTEVLSGSNYAQILENWNKANPKKTPITINYVADKTSVVNRLQRIESGAIDFILYDAISLTYIAEDQGIELEVNKVKDKLGSERDGVEYLIFSKDKQGQKLQAFVNKRLKKLAKDGTLKKLSEKHFGGDFSPASKTSR